MSSEICHNQETPMSKQRTFTIVMYCHMSTVYG